MSWRDDPYIRALMRGAVLLLSVGFIGSGVAMLVLYLIGFQKESLWIGIGGITLGIACLLWDMAEINGLFGARKG